jgi:hypothetical protein
MLERYQGCLTSNAGRSAFRLVALLLQTTTTAQLHSALRSVSHRGVVAGQDFDDHRIDGYHSS